jgi:NhaP-type Na+/H+ or K+/H+ antiporter
LLGWFGPRGAASIVFALLVLEEGGLPHDDVLLATAFVTVGLSVFAHGASAAPLVARYAGWLDRQPATARAPLESDAKPELRWRLEHEAETA